MFYKLPSFKYHRANTLEEALKLVNELEDFKIVAGGTDLIMDLKIRRYIPKNIIDISRVKELDYIVDEGDRIRIGALTRLQEIVDSPIIREKAYVLAEAVNQMASWQIRNMATIGGNLCNASPAADTAPPLYVLNAELKLVSVEGERIIPVTKFFHGPRRTELKKNELLAEIIIPVEKDAGASALKLGRRTAFTLSIVAVATLVKVKENELTDVRVALNSVAPTPVRAPSVERALIGREVSLETVDEAAKLVVNDINPITDVRASADYRREMSVVLTRDSLLKSLKRIGIKLGGEE